MTKPGPRQHAASIELLYFDGCPNYRRLLARVRAIVAEQGAGASVELHRVESDQMARRRRFLGSPTLRVDGRDIEAAAATRDDFGLKCRLYLTADGLAGIPPDEWIRDALAGRYSA